MSPQHTLPRPNASDPWLAKATRANTDEQLLSSWLASIASDLTRRNFAMTARRFLVELPMGMRKATIEDVRDVLTEISVGKTEASTRQYVGEIPASVRPERRLCALQRRRHRQGAL